MKTVIVALLLGVGVQSVTAQAPGVSLTAAERARVAGDVLTFLDSCRPIERTVRQHREVVRFQCRAGIAVVDVFSGALVPTPTWKRRVKRWGITAVSTAIALLFIYARSQSQ